MEGGVDVLWEHDSSTLTPCREIETRKSEEDAQMGYPEESCKDLRRLLRALNCSNNNGK